MCALCLWGMMVTTASAETRWFKFTDVTTQKTYSVAASKADNEQRWYLTLVDYNIETGERNSTLASNNVFGCRLHRVSGGADNVDIYRKHNHYKEVRYDYQSTVHKNDSMKIKGKKDDSSTSNTNLRVYGKYTP